jgi:hypothetical protein
MPLFQSTPFCSSFKVSGLILRFLIHFELILVQGERQGSGFSLQHLWKRLSFYTMRFELFCQKSVECSCINSYLGLLFCSLVFMSVFCANTILLLLLWHCSIVWSWVFWCLQHWTFCSELHCSLIFWALYRFWLLFPYQMNSWPRFSSIL